MDSVIEVRYPLSWLADSDLEGSFNRPHHGLSLPDLTDTLIKLFQRKDLIAAKMRQTKLADTFVPTPSEILAALKGELDADYQLTPQGGMRWESIVQPKWQRYINAGDFLDPDLEEEFFANSRPLQHPYLLGDIIAVDRQLIEQSLSLLRQIKPIVPESETWETLVPWQATYWKTLPVGHRVWYRYAPASETALVSEDEVRSIEERLHTLKRWYTNPFEQQESS